jgi:hypothetical protein
MCLNIFNAFDLPGTRAAPAVGERSLTGPQILAGHLYFSEICETNAADEEIGNSATDGAEIFHATTEVAVSLHDRRLIRVARRFDESSSDSRHRAMESITGNAAAPTRASARQGSTDQ